MCNTSDLIPNQLNALSRTSKQLAALMLRHRSAWRYCGANCPWTSIVARWPLATIDRIPVLLGLQPRSATVAAQADERYRCRCMCVKCARQLCAFARFISCTATSCRVHGCLCVACLPTGGVCQSELALDDTIVAPRKFCPFMCCHNDSHRGKNGEKEEKQMNLWKKAVSAEEEESVNHKSVLP